MSNSRQFFILWDTVQKRQVGDIYPSRDRAIMGAVLWGGNIEVIELFPSIPPDLMEAIEELLDSGDDLGKHGWSVERCYAENLRAVFEKYKEKQ